ncbi:baseplate J/gp47 family protein [bacterium]|nr:baseplate J/gp47 family protein [bacterium]
MSNNEIKFLEYDSQAEEQKLVNLFEEQTGRTLYPAQDERLLISIIEYKASLLVNKFNEAAKQNLTQYSRGEILDNIGDMFDTKRLDGEKGKDTIQIELNTTFTYDFTIPKGTEILSKDEESTFETTEDLIIPAGETVGTVEIEAKEVGSKTNVYGIGDINTLVKPMSYIEKITNLNGIHGGSDEESDEAYIKRILLAPERFTCAGSRQSYIYHTLSANPSIIDATAQSVKQAAEIKIGNTTYTENDGIIETPDFTAEIDHKKGTFNFTLNETEYTFSIPSDSTVNIYPLIENGETPQSILDEVEQILNGENVNPMTDNVIAISPTEIQKSITVTVHAEQNSDLATITQKVNSAIDEYKSEKNKKLNVEILPSQIIAKVGSIEGVYSVDTGSLTPTTANVNEYFTLNFSVNVIQ